MLIDIRMLIEAGLTPDWMTLYVGWRGIELDYGDVTLPFADVQAYACDQLAVVAGTETEDAVFRIADADRADDIEEVFRSFATTTGVSEKMARRRWRFAILSCDVPNFATAIIDAKDLDYNDHLALGYDLYALLREYGDLSEENPLPSLPDDWNIDDAWLSEFEQWLDSERAVMSEEQSAI